MTLPVQDQFHSPNHGNTSYFTSREEIENGREIRYCPLFLIPVKVFSDW